MDASREAIIPALPRFRPLILIAFTLASILTHAWRLESNPLWYTDEANYIRLAASLGDGAPLAWASHKALIFPFASDAVPHPPLFFCLNGLLIRLFGESILCGRGLSAALALISSLLLYDAVRLLWGRLAGFLAAGLFSFHLPTVLFFRWGMPYNLCVAFQIAAFWALSRAQRGNGRSAWALISAAFAGGAAVSAFFGVATLLFVTLLILARHRREPRTALGALALGWSPIALFLAIGVHLRGDAFWRDLLGLGLRAGGEGGIESLEALAGQIIRVFSRDFVYALGLIGLVWVAAFSRGRRWAPLLFLACAVPVLLKRGRDPEIKYDEPTFLFLIHAGAGVAAAAGGNKISKWRGGAGSKPGLRRLPTILWAGAVVALGVLAGIRIHEVATRIPSKFERVGSVLNVADAYRLAGWANARIQDEDLVIAPERVDFLLKGKVTSLYQSVAYVHGGATWHRGIERWRFAFPCDYRKARFIVVDHTDLSIVLHPANPNMEAVKVELSNPARWSLAAEIGEYLVFERRS